VTPAVILLVLCAALLHASWNAVLRSGADRLWSITVMTVAAGVAALPVALIRPLPATASWPYILLSAALHVGYNLFLVLAYRHGELGQVYPIARGSSPLLVTLGAAVFAGERIGLLALSGVVLVSLGIISLARGKGSARSMSIATALTTGGFIACYTVTDGIGARLSGDAHAYAAWLFLLDAFPMPILYLARRGCSAPGATTAETVRAATGGVISLLAYGAVIWAVTLGPMGPVSALRETSVVFAALIGRYFLRETLTARRLGACAVIALGALCLGVHP
jgi:drug/metabolite transporter (DMT)-like permease